MFNFFKGISLSPFSKPIRPECKGCSEKYHDQTLWDIVHLLTHRIEELEKKQKDK
jgi:hypothetical protein